ncbi:MAG: right-handed parallel beta-helix repeat-containing protein [Caldilineaceae bacterium]
MNPTVLMTLALTVLLLSNQLALREPTFTTTFYLAENGNDANSGRAADRPWRTLERLQSEINQGTLQPGDQMLFARGSTFTGTLVLNSKVNGSEGQPITFAAYGRGAAPVINGLSSLHNWQALGSKHWQVVCDDCTAIPAFLLIDGEPQPLARWPNLNEGDEGYRYYNDFRGSISITDETLPPDKNWVGGEVVLRSIAWILDRLPILAQSGGTLTFSVSSSYEITPGWGYFIQNHLNALDQDGEWVYDATSKTITIQSGDDPNQHRIEIPSESKLLTIHNGQHLVFRDLALVGAATDLVEGNNCSAITFEQVSLRYAGDEAFNTIDCERVTLRDSLVQDSMNVGLRMVPCPHCLVTGTKVERIGLLAGMGGNGDGQYFATQLGGEGFVIEKSVVSHVGYLGISLYGAATARNNLIEDFNRVKNDGAGIYTYRSSDIAILSNIVRDATGSKAGNAWGSVATNGIYIDDNSEQVTVKGNSVANIGSAGIYLHNTRNVTVTENLVYNAGEAGITLTDDELGDYALENTLLRQNQVTVHNVPMIQIQSNLSDNLFDTLGTIDENRFCDPFADPVFSVNLPTIGARTKSLAPWQNNPGYDRASTLCPDRYPERTISGTPGANIVNNGNFDNNLDAWFGWPDDTLDARWENDRLEGGSLWLGFKGSSNWFHYDTVIGPVQKGQTYRLRFHGLSLEGTPSLKVYLRQLGEPYAMLSQSPLVPLDQAAQDFTFYFEVNAGEAETILVFEMDAPGSTVGIDNVVLQAVDAPPVLLKDVARFETNPGDEMRVLTLDRNYRTVEGTLYPSGSSLQLAPYQSVVLLPVDERNVANLHLPLVYR